MTFIEKFKSVLKKDVSFCSNSEIYTALLACTKSFMQDNYQNKKNKKVYYISAEFLIGKLLSNNLINLSVYDEVRDFLSLNGKNISEIEEIDAEPSLGNGGLGRLAACFLDSMATLGINGDGIGLNYHFGLFKQYFSKNMQQEKPDYWIEKNNSWLNKSDFGFEVPFNDFTLRSKAFYIDVLGYNSKVNKLHLFDLESVDEKIVGKGISFDKEDIKRNLTLFLYPDDSDKKGELLRIYQQYFMVSNAAQLILKELKENGFKVENLDEHVVIQINDTHPSMIIPELIRLLGIEGVDEDKAVEIVSRTCCYTNHTILAEALEKWPLEYLEEVVPHLLPIIKMLDKRIEKKYSTKNLQIIDEENRVHMAKMDIHYSKSVNGVAYLHTEILKNVELNDFYKIYPEKFNNKTNGITFRRWLLHSNKDLVRFLDENIGGDFRKDATKLEKLLSKKDDEKCLNELLEVKKSAKITLKKYILENEKIDLNENSIFDIQIKRLHEYKRQQMNVLYIIYKYLQIKSGKLPKRPISIIFGGKAAPAYIIAKDIIHAILCLQKLIENDSQVNPYLQVVMVENYNVSYAEKLIPACDVSEQISLASKEASGTGNMKFMLNGAVTLGTEDGANLEIHELVGDENIYIFGEKSDTVINLYEKNKKGENGYVAKDFYINDAQIREWVDFLICPEMLKIGDAKTLLEIHAELIKKDWFMTLLDVKEYIKTKEKVFEDYENRLEWAKKMLVNIAKSGFFSSDRTIMQYNDEIWKA